jgi:hypothetical protein
VIFLKFNGKHLEICRAFAGDRRWVEIGPGTKLWVPFYPQYLLVSPVSITRQIPVELKNKKVIVLAHNRIVLTDYATNLRQGAVYQLDTGYNLNFVRSTSTDTVEAKIIAAV